MSWAKLSNRPNLYILIAFLSVFNLATSQSLFAENRKKGASEGVLPRGKTPGPGRLINLQKPNERLPDCYDYHSNAYSGQFILREDWGKLFLLTKDNSQKASNMSLLSLDLSSLKMKKILHFKSVDGTSFTIHGKSQLEGISTFNFRNASYGCGNGVSEGFGIKIGASGVTVFESFPEKLYKLVPSDDGPLVADMTTNILRLFDVKSLQSRPLLSFPQKAIPLYASVEKLSVLYVVRGEKKNILAKYDVKSGKKTELLKFGFNMKLVSQGERFGLMQVKDNRAFLRLFRKVSSEQQQGLYEFPLPSSLVNKAVSVHLNFVNKVAAVIASYAVDRRSVRDAYLIDGRRKRLLFAVKSPEGYFVSDVVQLVKSNSFLFIHRSLESEEIGLFTQYDIEKRVIKDVQVVYE